MSSAPRGERLIITLLGNRNSGKSSLINALTGQEIAIVSDTPGTTTDPVDKRYELLPLGPVTLYDTAGLDDVGGLGKKRVEATYRVLFRTDMAIFVNDGQPFGEMELEMLNKLREMKIPHLVVFNKSDLRAPEPKNIEYCDKHGLEWVSASASKGENVSLIKEKLVSLAPPRYTEDKPLVRDLVKEGELVVLVTPIDPAAPKGRLILPQVQVLRDLLDARAMALVTREFELKKALASLKSDPDLVITDSQAIAQVVADVPEQVKLTTFSILFARYKVDLGILAEGVRQIDKLQDGDRVLIAEACSHHVQEDDIGRAKIPRWVKAYTKKDLSFEAYAGHDYPMNLEDYALVIHCGACMLNQAEMSRRIVESQRRGVPITNYGLTISKVHGYFDRAIAPLGM